VLRRTFGLKRDEMMGEWRKLHNEELHNFYSSSSMTRIIEFRMRWAEHVALMNEERNVYRLLVGKPEGRRQLERPRHRWEDNIRMDLREVRWVDVDWIGLAQDRNRWRALLNLVLNVQVAGNAGKVLSGFTTAGLLSSAQLHRVSFFFLITIMSSLEVQVPWISPIYVSF
jgi:hypothetical protein